MHVAVFQYVVITVCIKAGLETSAWTYVSVHSFLSHLQIILAVLFE